MHSLIHYYPQNMSVTFWQAPSMKRSATVHTELNLKQIEHPKKSPFPCERNDSMIKIVGPKEMSRRPSVKDLASDVYIAASAEKQIKLKKPQSEVTILVNAFIQYFKSVKERKQDMKKTWTTGQINTLNDEQ
ncbi:hypothetical protein INT43_003509 [Umbelopsis isabellina]|uniref:Uncharacterized protein n=1 Tax=Mortierella isabellina TaxID=91625 RepID=A0A8H7PQJ6_MORIS|nr:hypothetical protein INT43_003509 [Umbelopsis isabellina]